MASGLGAVAVVALLLATGVLPLGAAGPWENGITYLRAEELAAGAVPPPYTGATSVLAAVGVASRTGGTLPVSALAAYLSSNCTVTPLGGYPFDGEMAVPVFYGSFGAGRSPFWVVVFQTSSSGPYIVTAVTDGMAEPVAELSGPACAPSGYAVNPLPDGVVDSPTAARAAWDAEGAGYAEYLGASTLVMAAFGGTSGLPYFPPLWLLVYAPCDPVLGGTSPAPAGFVALSLTTAAPLFTTVQNVGCPP